MRTYRVRGCFHAASMGECSSLTAREGMEALIQPLLLLTKGVQEQMLMHDNRGGGHSVIHLLVTPQGLFSQGI